MATKPESQFRRSVNKYLASDTYHQGMGGTYTGGTPDDYYEGLRCAMWAEYKFLPRVPKTFCLMNPKAKVKLTALQTGWLERALNNNVKVVVIVGCPDGGIILVKRGWEDTISHDEFFAAIKTRKELAQWITRETTRYGGRSQK